MPHRAGPDLHAHSHTTQDQVDRELVLRLFSGCPLETVPAGRQLLMQNDNAGRIFGLLDGVVEISIVSSQGHKLVMDLAHAPSVVGELSVLDGGTAIATVICRSTCELVSLSRPQLLDRLDNEPGLSRDIIHLLCRRLRWVSDQLGDRTFLDIQARLAKRLLTLAVAFSDPDGWLVISQIELAQTLGATRESVNKILNEWQTQGTIAIRRGKIRVLEKARLQRIEPH